MNDSHILSLLEQLVALYETNGIIKCQATFSPEFISLIGDIKDALSNIE